ncbi:MAG: hypothetical protein WCW25_03980 [Patescibacteria group bacterium]|jgi:hypothetical protein
MKDTNRKIKIKRADEFLGLAEELKKAHLEYLKRIDEIIKKRDKAIKAKLRGFNKINQVKSKYGK